MLKLMNSYVKSILHRWEKVTSPSGEVEIKVTHTHTQKQGKKVCVVEAAGGGRWGLNAAGRSTHPPPLHLTSLCLPPRSER